MDRHSPRLASSVGATDFGEVNLGNGLESRLATTAKERWAWGNVWKFEKQYGTRRLRVIAELHKETCYILTSFWI